MHVNLPILHNFVFHWPFCNQTLVILLFLFICHTAIKPFSSCSSFSMASSSSSHQRNQESHAFSALEPAGKRRRVSESSTLYDVFINHRGPDCKGTLATKLYKSLEELGIRAFLDSEEKELGISFPSTIETAIRSAKVHIAIFSKGYAESPWCLTELDLMLHSTAKIIPVFYHVKPSDLRHIKEGKGVYSGAFIEYKEKGRYLDKLDAWMEALQSLSLIAGEEFSEGDCQKIVAAARKEVQRNTFLHVADHPVGLNNLVEDFQKQCLDKLVQDFQNHFGLGKGKHKAQVAPIFGMGGVGKTTLAKELFNRKKSNYSTRSFLFDVREAQVKGNLPSLQCKLLKDLFNEDCSFTSTEEGKSYLKDRLRRVPNLRALIVVDDIDHVEQLNALAVMDISNQSANNLVIVTTRDAGVLINAGITNGYNLKGMNSNYATELFCWYAFCQDHPRDGYEVFCQDHPRDGYEVLVKDFVDVCGGLPLSLRVLGSLVHGRTDKYWSSTLDKVRKTLPRDVKQRLRISFDALDDEEKQVFMDVACFFLGKPKRMAERICEASGWDGQHALETLKDRCLIEEIEDFPFTYQRREIVLRMHDHLRDLGREMARERELSSPRRLWQPQDLKSLELKGLKKILEETNARCFHTIFDASICCEVTFFLGHSEFCGETPASVLWLRLDFTFRQFPSIPSWIPLQKLNCLTLSNANLIIESRLLSQRPKQVSLCRELVTQAPSHFEELLISQTSLKEISDLLGTSDSLEHVFLDAKHWPIQGLSLIEFLNMDLSSICLKLSTLKGEQVSVKRGRTFCKSLVIVDFKFNEKVDWNNGGISASVKAPASGLEYLEISYEIFLSKICICGSQYPRLKSIKLDNIDNLMEVNLTSVKTLNCLAITHCLKIQRIIIDILSCVEDMKVDTCEKLQSIMLPTTLCSLSIRNCRNLQRVSGNGDFKELTELTICDCPELEELTSLSGASCVDSIEVDTCAKLQSIMLPTTLYSLSIRNCRNLQRVSGNGDFMELKELTICDCPELEELPSLARLSCMNNIEVRFCAKLENIAAGFEELQVSESLRLNYCSNAIIRNCIHKLKNPPSYVMTMIGEAVDAAESILNEYLFSEAQIGADSLTDVTHYTGDVTHYTGDNAVIDCYLVDRSTWIPEPSVLEGEWIITRVEYGLIRREDVLIRREEYGYFMEIEDVLRSRGLIKKGFRVEVKRGEEWKIVGVLRTIVDRLHSLGM